MYLNVTFDIVVQDPRHPSGKCAQHPGMVL